MKSKISIVQIALVLLAGFILIIYSCKKVTNPTEGVQVIVDYDLIETTFSVKFIDATTGELIGLQDKKQVNIEIGGKDAKSIIDITGLKKNVYKSVNGFIELALNPNIEPTTSDPVEFTLMTSCDGYLSTSKPVEIVKKEKTVFAIRMVNISDPPKGVSRIIDKSGSANSTGEIQNNIVVTTPNGMAKLLIPEGAILQTEYGVPLSGTIEVQLTHFSNMEDESLRVFPGGLNTNVRMQDGSYQQVIFFSAGFIALEILDEDGDYADTVMINPMELTMKIPEQTYNPDNKGGIKDGDTVPVWSYNVDNGRWNYEATDTVNTEGGEYIVSTEMWHLSWWNWDWLWPVICDEGMVINFVSDEYYCNCYWWNVDVRNSYNNTLMWSTYMYACEDEKVRLYNAPAGIPVDMYFYDDCLNRYTEKEFYHREDLCAPDELTIRFFSEQVGTTVDVEISAYCASNPDYIILPTLSYWVRKWDDWCFRWFSLVEGKGKLCGIEIGEEYVMGIYLDGEWYEYTFTVQDTLYVEHDIPLPGEVCSEIFGL